MKPVDITRLIEVARFLEANERYITTCGNLEITLQKSANWLYVGMCWTDTGYRWGRNLDNNMRHDDNIEYWIMHVVLHMDKRRKENEQKQNDS